jgi:hypothetical protein
LWIVLPDSSLSERVGHALLAERRVADRQVEEALGHRHVLEAAVRDVGALVELLGDRRAGRVELDAEQHGVAAQRFRHEAEEVPDAHGRLEHAQLALHAEAVEALRRRP